MAGIDINKLKAEISSRKTEITSKEVALGNNTKGGVPKLGKKAFLNELVTSMHRGVKTNATEAIKVLNETVEAKNGMPNAAAKNAGKYVPPTTRLSNQHLVEQQPVIPTAPANDWGLPSGVAPLRGGDGERDDLFESQNAKFDQMMMKGNPTVGLLQKEGAIPQQQRQYVTEQAMPINEQFDQLLTEKLDRNLEKLVESAFKSVLTNIYTKQKIQESLTDFLESEEFVKVVGRAINEIAKRNKSKSPK